VHSHPDQLNLQTYGSQHGSVCKPSGAVLLKPCLRPQSCAVLLHESLSHECSGTVHATVQLCFKSGPVCSLAVQLLVWHSMPYGQPIAPSQSSSCATGKATVRRTTTHC